MIDLKIFFLALSVLFLGACASKPSVPESHRKLLLIGGGKWENRTKEAFLDLAHGGQVLMISWATESPEEAWEYFTEKFVKERPSHRDLVFAVQRPELMTGDSTKDLVAEKKLLEQIETAQSIFFSGGDQAYIMKVFEAHPAVKSKILEKYGSGTPLAGTSAGTAIMSKTMIDSEKGKFFKTQGLGTLPSHVIVDQHFDTRKREPRLKDILSHSEETIGMGIAEGSAVLVTDGHLCKNLGPGNIIILDKIKSPHRVILKTDEQFDF